MQNNKIFENKDFSENSDIYYIFWRKKLIWYGVFFLQMKNLEFFWKIQKITVFKWDELYLLRNYPQTTELLKLSLSIQSV